MILIFSISEISLITDPSLGLSPCVFLFSFSTNVAEWSWLPAQWLDQIFRCYVSLPLPECLNCRETIEEDVVCEAKGSVTRPNKKVFGCSWWCFNPAWDNVAQQKNNHWIYIYIYTCVDSCLWVVLISISLLSYPFEATNQLLFMGLWISLFWPPPIHVVTQLPRDPFQMFETF